MARRIVTGNRADGTSYFVSDGPMMPAVDFGEAQITDVWVDEQDRSASDNDYDPVRDGLWKLIPPDGASVVRFVSLMPDERLDMPSEAEMAEARKRFDLGDSRSPTEDDSKWHTTPTIDYGIVLEGEIVLELDEGEVTMGVGDIVIQRKTLHAWRNRTDKPCRMVFVLISSPAYQ